MYADDTTIYFNTEDFAKDNLAKHITTELDKVYLKLPSYFNYYLEVINNAFPCQYALRQIARPLIRPQRTRLVFTESNVLFSIDTVIKLHTHTHTHTHYPEILENVKYKTHTYHGFSYNVREKYLGTYNYECSNLIGNRNIIYVWM